MIRKAEINDLRILAELACRLWPEHTPEELSDEFAQIMELPDAAFFLACEDGIAVGSLSASCGMTMWRERNLLPLATWRASLWRKSTASRALPETSCLPAKHGPKAKAAQNLPATVSWIMYRAYNFT